MNGERVGATGQRSGVLEVTGGWLHYEVRGSGPVVLLIPGAPADGAVFAGVADILAHRYTVVTYDVRGTSRSVATDPAGLDNLTGHGDDAGEVILAVGGGPASVVGCSGGGLIGLDLLARHPGSMRRLVVHEPPAMNVLADAATQREVFEGIRATYRSAGVGPAMQQFIAAAVAVPGDASGDAAVPAPPPAPALAEPDPGHLAATARMQANAEVFLAHLLPWTLRYTPDLPALRRAAAKITVAVGETSKGQMPHRAGATLAALLGTEPVYVPGDHTGFLSHPDAFAATVIRVLDDQR